MGRRRRLPDNRRPTRPPLGERRNSTPPGLGASRADGPRRRPVAIPAEACRTCPRARRSAPSTATGAQRPSPSSGAHRDSTGRPHPQPRDAPLPSGGPRARPHSRCLRHRQSRPRRPDRTRPDPADHLGPAGPRHRRLPRGRRTVRPRLQRRERRAVVLRPPPLLGGEHEQRGRQPRRCDGIDERPRGHHHVHRHLRHGQQQRLPRADAVPAAPGRRRLDCPRAARPRRGPRWRRRGHHRCARRRGVGHTDVPDLRRPRRLRHRARRRNERLPRRHQRRRRGQLRRPTTRGAWPRSTRPRRARPS